MRIVIIGAGKLGYSIAELLSNEQYDVVVVDQNEERLEAVKNNLDVLTILANGASPITMNDPDIRNSDILVAVTAIDEVNMVSCILAKKHGIRYTAARIRDMQFMSEAQDYLKENFDIDLMLNPELITAREIDRILMMPAALDVEDFANGKVRLFETKVRRHSHLANVPLKDLQMPKSILAGMIFRDHRMIIPHGDDCLLPHDNAYFIGDPKAIEKFSENFIPSGTKKVERAMIIGAGRTGRFLAPMMDKQGVRVKVIEQDRETLFMACEAEAFYLQPDGLSFCEPIPCQYDMGADILEAEAQGCDVLKAYVDSPEDAENFAENSHMIRLPVCISSHHEVALEMALMEYNGRAFVDLQSELTDSELYTLAKGYGAVVV